MGTPGGMGMQGMSGYGGGYGMSGMGMGMGMSGMVSQWRVRARAPASPSVAWRTV